ncbi:MAG: DUF6186 family protein [Acidimicrobiia bacterium]
MSSTHTLTLVGYGAIVLAGVAIEIAARHREGSGFTFDKILTWALHTRSGRLGIFAAWAWLGLHFLG